MFVGRSLLRLRHDLQLLHRDLQHVPDLNQRQPAGGPPPAELLPRVPVRRDPSEEAEEEAPLPGGVAGTGRYPPGSGGGRVQRGHWGGEFRLVRGKPHPRRLITAHLFSESRNVSCYSACFFLL